MENWTSIPSAWLLTKLFVGMLALCLFADYVAKRHAKQTPKGADAWQPDGVKFRMISDEDSISRN